MAECCRDALFHGMLVSCREYSEKAIVFSSECEQVARLFASVYKAKYGRTLSEKRESVAGHKMFVLTQSDADAVSAVHADFDLFSEPYRINEGIVYCCDKCSAHFLRGLFLAKGHISEPTGENRLEIGVRGAALAKDIEGLLAMISLPPSSSLRRGKPLLLYKKSANIENFLGFIGADGAVLEIMNEKLVKDLRNDTNRRLNIETSGMNRSVSTAVKQIDMIKKLEESGRIGLLPEDLQETAKLRLLYGTISLSELAAKHEPPITKSGVSHRLEKITEFAKDCEN